MTFQPTPYTELLVFSAVLSGSLSVYAVHRHRSATRNPGSLLYFAVLMAAAACWSGTYAIGISEVEYGPKVFWLTVTNLFTVVAPTAWLAFALSYTDNDHQLTRRAWSALAVEPIVVVTVILTAQNHDLYYLSVERVNDPGFWVLSRELGPMFILHAAYSYALVVAGALVFLKFVRLDEGTYRGQALLLVGGSLLPVVSNVAFVLDVFGDNVNLTSVVLGLSGLAFATAISRYRFFELAPLARDTVVERMRDGYVMVDENGAVVDSNEAASQVLGVPDDLVGMHLREVLPEVADAVERGQAAEHGHGEVTRQVDGDRRHLDVSTSELESVEGTLVVLRDVTDERRAERRFQTLIEGSSDIITVFDADGVVTYVSPSVERVLGIPPEDIVGLHVSETIHPEDSEAVTSTFDTTPRESGFGNRVEYRAQDADGDWRYLEAAGRNLLDDESVSGIVVNARDVTERKEREQRLEETMSDLERTNERLERFASVVSHDLRNPLNVADGYAELLEERVDDPAVGEIRTSHDRMRRIIDDVLALAQDDDVTERSAVSLEALAEEAWEAVDTKDATLAVDEGTVVADRTRLARVFENLFRNSIEHGGASVSVTVGPLSDVDGFYVADDGPGIPGDVAGSLFEEGVSGDGGTGLGLAIVADIVNAHGWTVEAVADGDGARFEVRSDDQPVLSTRE
ncbi:histidine kinase N-terminal 7TM domain-containing protein [Halorubellus salinus]|uniref:histidine kinase N-terminal 7TM domain-containing protein n=1 Tax=Halorubellus salinus TaxID=755309 RepID=UPI001D08C73D|nr:histidine kinase N-terminal 7TM domain-containing protein [Halorubellus salinus]